MRKWERKCERLREKVCVLREREETFRHTGFSEWEKSGKLWRSLNYLAVFPYLIWTLWMDPLQSLSLSLSLSLFHSYSFSFCFDLFLFRTPSLSLSLTLSLSHSIWLASQSLSMSLLRMHSHFCQKKEWTKVRVRGLFGEKEGGRDRKEQKRMRRSKRERERQGGRESVRDKTREGVKWSERKIERSLFISLHILSLSLSHS